MIVSNQDWAVGLDVPADSRHLHIVRLTAAGAAAEAGLSTEEIEDVKIAIDELCSVFIAAATPEDRIVLRFAATTDSLLIEAPGNDDTHLIVDDLARTILEATVDELVIGPEAPSGGFRILKRRRGN